MDCSAVIGTSLAGVSFSCWSLWRWRLDVYVSLSLSLSALIVVQMRLRPARRAASQEYASGPTPANAHQEFQALNVETVRALACSMKRCQSGTHALHHRSFS